MVSSATLPPGGEGKIEVTVSTRGRPGRLEKTVVVESNDQRNPRLTLKVVGMVEVEAGFEPRYLNLGRILKGTIRTEKVKVVGKQKASLRLLDLVSSDPARVSGRILQEEDGPALEVTVKAGLDKGPINATLTAKTNLERPSEIALRISGLVDDDIGAEPSQVFFGPFDPAKPQSISLRLKAISGKPFKVLRVEDKAQSLQASAEERNGEWTVRVTLLKDPPNHEGLLKIVTDRAPVEVPYHVGGQRDVTRSNLQNIRLPSIPKAVKVISPSMPPQERPATR